MDMTGNMMHGTSWEELKPRKKKAKKKTKNLYTIPPLQRNTIDTIKQLAIKKITEVIDGNQELFIAQIIKANPDINLLNYTLCRMDTYGNNGAMGMKFWLEEK